MTNFIVFHNIIGEIQISHTFVTVHGKTYSNNFPCLSRIPFTTVCKPFEKICIRSNYLVTRSLERPTHSNDLVTRSLETPTHLNDLVTHLLETPTRSNNLTSCLLETATHSNELVTGLQETPTCWIKYM